MTREEEKLTPHRGVLRTKVDEEKEKLALVTEAGAYNPPTQWPKLGKRVKGEECSVPEVWRENSSMVDGQKTRGHPSGQRGVCMEIQGGGTGIKKAKQTVEGGGGATPIAQKSSSFSPSIPEPPRRWGSKKGAILAVAPRSRSMGGKGKECGKLAVLRTEKKRESPVLEDGLGNFCFRKGMPPSGFFRNQ